MPTCVMLHASTPTPCFPYLPRSISRQGWIKWYKHRSSGLLRKWDSQWATKSLFFFFFLTLRPLAEAQPLKSKAGSKTRFKSRSATLAETWPESSRRVCPADTPATPTTRTRQAVRVLADWRLVWLTAGIRSGPLDRDNLSFRSSDALSPKTSHCQFVPQVLSPPPAGCRDHTFSVEHFSGCFQFQWQKYLSFSSGSFDSNENIIVWMGCVSISPRAPLVAMLLLQKMC